MNNLYTIHSRFALEDSSRWAYIDCMQNVVMCVQQCDTRVTLRGARMNEEWSLPINMMGVINYLLLSSAIPIYLYMYTLVIFLFFWRRSFGQIMRKKLAGYNKRIMKKKQSTFAFALGIYNLSRMKIIAVCHPSWNSIGSSSYNKRDLLQSSRAQPAQSLRVHCRCARWKLNKH